MFAARIANLLHTRTMLWSKQLSTPHPNSLERGQTPSTAAPQTPSSCSLPSLSVPSKEGKAVTLKSLCTSKHLRLTTVSGWYLTDHGTSETASREPIHMYKLACDHHNYENWPWKDWEGGGGLEICITFGIHMRTFYHVRFWYKHNHLSYTGTNEFCYTSCTLTVCYLLWGGWAWADGSVSHVSVMSVFWRFFSSG